MKLKNCFKQLVLPFMIYADFESFLKGFQSNGRSDNTSYTKQYQDHIPCSFAYKVVCIDDKFNKPSVLYRVKHSLNKFIETILKEYDYCKNVIK